MSDIIERICKDLYNYAEKKHFNGEVELANGILKAKCYIEDEKEKYEELAKEPQEDIPVQCVNGSCPMALSETYEERGMDVVHSCEECQYQTAKEPQEENNMMVRAVNETHIREMQHCIGLDYKKPKRGRYEAYRNYFYCSVPNRIWEYLVEIGYAKCNIEKKEHYIQNTSYTYYLTQDGLDFMGIVNGCTITLKN